jgi:hypothetical protein
MKVQAYNVNREVGRILAGLEIGDRVTCLDFLRQHLGVEACVDVRTRKDVLLDRLADELKRKLEHDWYINSVRVRDVEALMRDIQEKAYEAKRDRDDAHYELVDDIREQDRFQQIIAARTRKEHEEERAGEMMAWRRERRARHDDIIEWNAMAYRRKRFEEYLKQMEKVYRGDGGYGLAISTALFMGDIEGAKRIFRSVPHDIKEANPMMQTALVLVEAFMAKPKRADKSSVLGVEVGSAFEYEGPFTMQAPSPFAH